jgi:hypothetical protein
LSYKFTGLNLFAFRYTPSALLKLPIWGYLNRVRSSRRLEIPVANSRIDRNFDCRKKLANSHFNRNAIVNYSESYRPFYRTIENGSARYATSLADDPGSSVLTITSLGLIERMKFDWCLQGMPKYFPMERRHGPRG